MNYRFRIYFEVAGGHVHCALFSCKIPGTVYAKLGDFVVSRGEEFRSLCAAFPRAEMVPRDGSTTEMACEA